MPYFKNFQVAIITFAIYTKILTATEAVTAHVKWRHS